MGAGLILGRYQSRSTGPVIPGELARNLPEGELAPTGRSREPGVRDPILDDIWGGLLAAEDWTFAPIFEVRSKLSFSSTIANGGRTK